MSESSIRLPEETRNRLGIAKYEIGARSFAETIDHLLTEYGVEAERV